MTFVLVISWMNNLKTELHPLLLHGRLSLLICFQRIEYRKVRIKFTLDKSGQHWLCQVVNVNIYSDVLIACAYSLMWWEWHFVSCMLHPNPNPSLIIRKYQANLNWIALYKISNQHFSKMWRSWKWKKYFMN